MNRILLAQVVLDRAERLKSMQDHFERGHSSFLWKIVLVVLILAAIYVLIQMIAEIQRRKEGPPRPQPNALFLRVLSRIGLPAGDRFLLLWLARATGIENPTALLISEHCYDKAVHDFTTGKGLMGSRARHVPRLKAIRTRLFSEV